MARIEALLSARLFLSPHSVGRRIFFLSNLGGKISLYAMEEGGSVPEPLLPPHIALQNPELVGGYPFYVFPSLEKILVMLDDNGDEKYQPMLVPLQGGFPTPAFGEDLSGYQVFCAHCDVESNVVYLIAASHTEQLTVAFRGNLATGELERLGESTWNLWVDDVSEDQSQAVLQVSYTMGDTILYHWTGGERELIYGVPLEQRDGAAVAPSGIHSSRFTPGNRGIVFITALFEDTYGLGYLDVQRRGAPEPISMSGERHRGTGELVSLEHLQGDRYLVGYNIDGCSWLYEARLHESQRHMTLEHVICGQGVLSNGVLEASYYDKETDRFVLSFSSATSPTQLYFVQGEQRQEILPQTRERLLGIPQEWLAPGEDAAFTSHDGLRISARLYRPAEALGFRGPRPLVYYVHGGPQSQERPDFAWFSMPLIQFLTLNGFAVFVPNVRGSSGYGLSYMKRVDRDWGGQDRLDHVHALKLLAQDPQLDTTRAAVVGRSYGGYMTLMLATRHPELWSAAVDMFGPYDLISFSQRIPETWKPYFAIALGDPARDRDFLIERSPRSYIDQIRCPLLVIQGKNDPRVTEVESREVVEHLRNLGKQVDYLMFEDEGHDVLKFENRVRCYNAITEFFKQHLQP